MTLIACFKPEREREKERDRERERERGRGEIKRDGRVLYIVLQSVCTIKVKDRYILNRIKE